MRNMEFAFTRSHPNDLGLLRDRSALTLPGDTLYTNTLNSLDLAGFRPLELTDELIPSSSPRTASTHPEPLHSFDRSFADRRGEDSFTLFITTVQRLNVQRQTCDLLVFVAHISLVFTSAIFMTPPIRRCNSSITILSSRRHPIVSQPS